MRLPPQIDKFIIPEPMSGCWLWLGALGKDGYGMAWDGALKKTLGAHRLVYEILVGLIPDGACVLHRCDNPCCVNPDHLFVGTKGDNNRDRTSKGRTAAGEKHPMNKLSEADVLAIRASSKTQCELANEYGVSDGLINHIKTRRLWKNLQGPIHRNRPGRPRIEEHNL